MSSLKLLSKVDGKTKDTVYGWIREAEKESQIGHIPMMLSSICILYYRDDEIFDASTHCNRSNDNKIATMKRESAGLFTCIYGVTKIESNSDNVYRWDLRINHRVKIIRVGISSDTKFADFVDALTEITTGIYMYSCLALKNHQPYVKKAWKNYGKAFSTEDEISIVLDLKKQTIKFWVNDDDQGIAFANVQKHVPIKFGIVF